MVQWFSGKRSVAGPYVPEGQLTSIVRPAVNKVTHTNSLLELLDFVLLGLDHFSGEETVHTCFWARSEVRLTSSNGPYMINKQVKAWLINRGL